VPVYTKNNLMPGYIDDSGTGIEVKDITMDWIAEHVWICGSEETVLEKLQALNDSVGGFGEVVMNTHDFIDDPKPFIESMHRFALGGTEYEGGGYREERTALKPARYAAAASRS